MARQRNLAGNYMYQGQVKVAPGKCSQQQNFTILEVRVLNFSVKNNTHRVTTSRSTRCDTFMDTSADTSSLAEGGP